MDEIRADENSTVLHTSPGGASEMHTEVPSTIDPATEIAGPDDPQLPSGEAEDKDESDSFHAPDGGPTDEIVLGASRSMTETGHQLLALKASIEAHGQKVATQPHLMGENNSEGKSDQEIASVKDTDEGTPLEDRIVDEKPKDVIASEVPVISSDVVLAQTWKDLQERGKGGNTVQRVSLAMVPDAWGRSAADGFLDDVKLATEVGVEEAEKAELAEGSSAVVDEPAISPEVPAVTEKDIVVDQIVGGSEDSSGGGSSVDESGEVASRDLPVEATGEIAEIMPQEVKKNEELPVVAEPEATTIKTDEEKDEVSSAAESTVKDDTAPVSPTIPMPEGMGSAKVVSGSDPFVPDGVQQAAAINTKGSEQPSIVKSGPELTTAVDTQGIVVTSTPVDAPIPDQVVEGKWSAFKRAIFGMK